MTLNKKTLQQYVISEAKKMLSLKENISDELAQANKEKGNYLSGKDEVGEFYVSLHPQENDLPEHITKKVTIPHLLNKVMTGEMKIEQIHSITKKENPALRNSNKLIKEFNDSLKSARKDQLKVLELKRSGLTERLSGSRKMMTGKVLDEETNMKFQRIEEHISKLDNEIARLQELLKKK
jgi:hypothetical protein